MVDEPLALGHELYWSGDEEQGVEVLTQALAEHADLGVELRHRLEAVVDALAQSSGDVECCAAAGQRFRLLRW